MERPLKRRRLDDEAEFDLYYRRAQNDRRLKSTFEDIFEKYGRDFEGVGDEIDLETGEIVVNNGHVIGMTNERDTGGVEDPEDEETEYDSDEWSDNEGAVTSSLLLETGRRLDALKYADLMQRGNDAGDELLSEGDADSLMGDNDSLMGDSVLESMSLPPTRSITCRPDSLCDDGSEDELASSEIEWPTPGQTYSTPRKVWPTPKIVTPLIHTPWRSSPIKTIRSNKPPTEPMWTAPPLPKHEKLQISAHPISRRQKTKNVEFQLPLQQPVLEAYSRTIPAQTVNPRNTAQDLNRQTPKRVAKSETLSGSLMNRSRRRRTMEEEDRLAQLRTTTRNMYSEIEPYCPGREVKAITIHWSDTNEKDRDLRCIPGSSIKDKAALSSNRDSPRMLQSRTKVNKSDMISSLSSPTQPHARSRDKQYHNILEPQSSKLDHDFGSPPAKIKQISKHHEIEARENRTSRVSQGASSILPYDASTLFLSRRHPSIASTSQSVKDEEVEDNVLQNTFPSSTTEANRIPQATSLRNAVRARSQVPSEPPVSRQQPELRKSIGLHQRLSVSRAPSASPVTDPVSTSRRSSSSTLKKPVFLPSYLDDDSDDELSTSFNTVGDRRN